MKENLSHILREVRERLAELYGERFRGLLLFGSYARGDAREESDIDLLILLDTVGSYAQEVERTSSIVGQISLKYGVSLSRVFVTAQRWQSAQTAFFDNIREEAVPA